MSCGITNRVACPILLRCFFFNDTATTEIYTLSLHDALPISILFSPWSTERCNRDEIRQIRPHRVSDARPRRVRAVRAGDRKSTRLNSSHANISYAVFCLKKKKTDLTSPARLYAHPSARQHTR